ESYCYFSLSPGSACLLGIDTDVGADTISAHLYNLLPPPNSFDSPPNHVSFTFAGVSISDVSIIVSSFPANDFAVSLANNVITWTHTAWTWQANSDYLIVLGVKTVPEPGTLALLGAGLIAIGTMRRRRAS